MVAVEEMEAVCILLMVIVRFAGEKVKFEFNYEIPLCYLWASCWLCRCNAVIQEQTIAIEECGQILVWEFI